MVNLPSARTLSAKLLGRWEREKDTYVLVVGVKADVYLDFEGPAPKLHEYRALFYSENILEARLQLLTWKYFAQEHDISFFIPVLSENLARLGVCEFIPDRTKEKLGEWVNPGGRWDGKEKRWHRQRQAARWQQS